MATDFSQLGYHFLQVLSASLAICKALDFEKLWFPFFISWLLKKAILKHGGMHTYRRTFPFFLGLVLGEFTMASIWEIIRLVTGQPTYAFKRW